MNFTIVALSLTGCFVYVCSMSALGRLLRDCRESSSVAYAAPAIAHRSLGA